MDDAISESQKNIRLRMLAALVYFGGVAGTSRNVQGLPGISRHWQELPALVATS